MDRSNTMNEYTATVARTLTDNQRPIAALASPTKIAYPDFPQGGNRQALYKAAERATNIYVREVAQATARMIRTLFPDANRVVFDQDEEHGEIRIDLLVIYGPNDTVLWYDTDDTHFENSDIARVVDEAEEDQGKLLIPVLDEDTKSQIEELISVAQERDFDRAWYTTSDLVLVDNGDDVAPKMYYGDIWEIYLEEELANPGNGEQQVRHGIAFGAGAHDAQVPMLNNLAGKQGVVVALLDGEQRVPDGDHFTTDDMLLVRATADGLRGYAVDSGGDPIEPRERVLRGWDTFTTIYVY